MLVEWRGGPHDGQMMEIEDGSTEVRIVVAPPMIANGSIDPDAVVRGQTYSVPVKGIGSFGYLMWNLRTRRP